jgi:hypothetical protein
MKVTTMQNLNLEQVEKFMVSIIANCGGKRITE